MPDVRPSFLDYALPSASLGVGIANSLMNYGSQRETRQTQIDLMRMQNEFNEKMMNKQMAWNTPSAQVQRLSAAGLNPALSFNDSAGSVDMPSGANVPQLSAPQTNFSDVVLNAAQSLNLLSESGLNNENTKGLSIDNQYRDAKNLVELDKLDSERGLNDTQRQYYNLLANITQRSATSQVQAFALANEKTQLEMDMIHAETEKFWSEKEVQDSIAALNWKEDDYRVPMLKAALKATNAKAAKDWAEVGYIGQLKWNTYEDTLKIQAERQGLKLDNNQVRALWPSVQEEMKLSLESMRKSVRQQGADYWNPFRYVGMALGGAAAGGVGGYMRNSGVGAPRRVIVRGFAP